MFRGESEENGEVAADVQRELLEIYMNRDVFDEIGQYFARGKTRRKVKLPRTKRR